jgi:hypothetical protein
MIARAGASVVQFDADEMPETNQARPDIGRVATRLVTAVLAFALVRLLDDDEDGAARRHINKCP